MSVCLTVPTVTATAKKQKELTLKRITKTNTLEYKFRTWGIHRNWDWNWNGYVKSDRKYNVVLSVGRDEVNASR